MITVSESNLDLSTKIARLVEERGWNQEDFARSASLNRHTVRQILHPDGPRRLRNATVSACARALGVSVHELRTWPVERLLPRGLGPDHLSDNPSLDRRYEQATQPELRAWMEHHPDRARRLSADEIDELLSLQGTGGPLTSLGVEHFASFIERRRELVEQVQVIAGTEYLDTLEQFVKVLYEKVQPYRDRKEDSGRERKDDTGLPFRTREM